MTMTINQKRFAVLCILGGMVGAVIVSYVRGGLAAQLFSPEMSNEEKVDVLREYFLGWGQAAPLVYLFVVVLEVVIAPIPGTLLYLPGGAIFGGFLGGLLALIGNVIGAGIACQLSRSMVQTHPEQRTAKMRRYIELIERRGFWIVFLLRLNPLTSSDLVSYAAGVTPLRTTTLMFATACGMTPLCFSQSYLSESLFDAFPALIWGLIVLCLIYALALTAWVLGSRGVAGQISTESEAINGEPQPPQQ